jgi:hypothetical protein
MGEYDKDAVDRHKDDARVLTSSHRLTSQIPIPVMQIVRGKLYLVGFKGRDNSVWTENGFCKLIKRILVLLKQFVQAALESLVSTGVRPGIIFWRRTVL